jgi:hypothetical protein
LAGGRELTAQYNGTTFIPANQMQPRRSPSGNILYVDMGATRIAPFIMDGWWECSINIRW